MIAPELGVHGASVTRTGLLVVWCEAHAPGSAARHGEVWDPVEKVCRARVALDPDWTFVALSSDASLVALRTRQALRVVATASGETLWDRSFTEGEVVSGAIDPRDAEVAVAVVATGCTLSRFALRDGRPESSIPFAGEDPRIAFTSRGDLVVSDPAAGGTFGSFSADVHETWVSRRAEPGFAGPFAGWPVFFSEEDDELIVAADREWRHLSAVSLADPSRQRWHPAGRAERERISLARGGRVLERSVIHGHSVFDPATGRTVWSAPLENGQAVLSPRGEWVAVVFQSAPPRGRVEVYELPP